MPSPPVPSRHEWLPAALPVLFGVEPDISDPWPGLLNAITRLDDQVRDVGAEAVRDVQGLGLQTAGWLDGMWDSTLSAGEDLRQAPMRVVLMGRTMAGKSSLLAALTRSNFDRIGDGRQRFSRNVFPVTGRILPEIEIVDTPGVGAYGGVDDTEMALRAALGADVVVWVNSSDSIQEESAEALRQLGLLGKPIMVVVNCRQSLEGVGRLNLLRHPDRVFGDKEDLIDEIRRHMSMAGVEPLGVVYVHALAATEALQPTQVDSELYEASRLDDLIAALEREHVGHSATRRAIRLVDSQRQRAAELAHVLGSQARTLSAQAEYERARTDDVHTRLRRVVRTAGEALMADVETIVGRRRDWHLTLTDFGPALQATWNKEIVALQKELDAMMEDRGSALMNEVKSTVAGAEREWATVSPDDFTLGELSAFDAVWANRALRTGIGVLGTTAVLVAGFLIGGPVGLAVGALGTPVVAYAVTPLKNVVDQIFLGKAEVLRRRREEVAKQVGPILDQVIGHYQKTIQMRLGELSDELGSDQRSRDADTARLDSVASRLADHGRTLHAGLRVVDQETTTALLRIDGRERLARSVRRATRVPGVCILAELDDDGFWEAWLFPPDVGETFAAGRTPPPGGEAVSALSYGLGLIDAPVSLVRASSEAVHLAIDADVRSTITGVWSKALAAHTGKVARIATGGKDQP